ncbi:MAG: metallophosphoesterase family protein, partial [Clostridiales bacterium]|nr:metallophosphoesterase family protein [Clostridiales bacterium]
ETNPPPLVPGDILLCGHTHIPAFNRHENFTYINPGSTSMPKNGSAHSYLLLEGETFAWKDLEDFKTWRTERI